MLYADGKIVTLLFGAKAGDIRVDKATGEIRPVRYSVTPTFILRATVKSLWYEVRDGGSRHSGQARGIILGLYFGYGVSRKTVHRWLFRCANEGMGALVNRTRPDRCPHQITPEIEASIVAMRKSHPGWDPRTILSKLKSGLT